MRFDDAFHVLPRPFGMCDTGLRVKAWQRRLRESCMGLAGSCAMWESQVYQGSSAGFSIL